MIAVNELIQKAYEALNMTGLGEATDGTMAKSACGELNELISQLNSEGYISHMQKFLDVSASKVITFRKLKPGETPQPHSIDMEAPEKIEGVARKMGSRYLPLNPKDSIQLFMKNQNTIPTSWNYGRDFEELPTEFSTLDETHREIGVLTLDGNSTTPLRIWYNSKLPKYNLDGKIYLSDLYNNMLFEGLKFRLAKFHDLADSKKAECETDFKTACNLIKRNNITQRMLQSGASLCGSYEDAYVNGFCPAQWG